MALRQFTNEELAAHALSLYHGQIRSYLGGTDPSDEEPASDNTAIGFVRLHKSEVELRCAETEYWRYVGQLAHCQSVHWLDHRP